MPLNLFYTMVQKSQKWPKTQIKGGSCLKIPFKTDLLVKTVWKYSVASWYKMPSKLLGCIGFLYKVVHETGGFSLFIFTIFFSF